MVSISFLHPQYLFFLLVIPLFIFIHLAALRSTKTAALKFANFEAIARIRGIDFFSRNLFSLGLSTLMIFLLTMSVSGLTIHTVIDASSHSYVIALDTSLSMEANDIDPSRIIAAKQAAIDFIETAPIVTKIGVISFSGNSIVEQSPTNEKSLAKVAINDVSLSPVGGTDVFDAVVTGTNLLLGPDEDGKGRALILLSDGQDNVGNVEQAINYANENNVIVHTIAIGTEEGGKTSYGLSKVDQESLEALAYNTDGGFFKVDSSQGFAVAFNQIIDKTERKVAIDFSRYSAIMAIILFAVMYSLMNSRYRSWP
jgi:Ca-activated chloride channel homolog